MSSTQETRSTPQSNEGYARPGAQLRRARENHRLSVEAVASQLHVLPKIIAALEADDYGNLPSPVFVRGYLRSYSRVVGLSPEPLIESYNSVVGSDAAVTVAEPEDSEERPLRWSIYLGVLAGLAAAVLWVNRQQLEQYWAKPAATAEEAASTAPTSESLEPIPITTAQTTLAPVPAPVAEQPAESPPPSAAPAAPTAAPPAAAAPIQQPPAQDAAEDSVAGHGPDQLTVRISKDSWVAIRDASGQRLLYGNLSAGTVKTIRGEAPFALVLGNASAAQVEFNGQSVDHSKYTVGAVARFKILK